MKFLNKKPIQRVAANTHFRSFYFLFLFFYYLNLVLIIKFGFSTTKVTLFLEDFDQSLFFH